MPATSTVNITNPGFGHLLHKVLQMSNAKTVQAVMQLNKDAHALVMSSSDVQIKLRNALYQYDPTYGFELPTKTLDLPSIPITSRARLDALIKYEKAHESLTMGTCRPFAWTGGPIVALQDRVALVAIDNGWWVTDVMSPGDHGPIRRTICAYQPWVNSRVAFCNKDSVVVEANAYCVHTGPTRVRIIEFRPFDARHRVYLPDLDSQHVSEKRPHPDAKFHRMTINIPPVVPFSASGTFEIELYPGGLAAALFIEPGTDHDRDSRSNVSQRCRTFIVVIDWKRGLVLGITKMYSSDVRITDLRFASPTQIVCASIRVTEGNCWVPSIDVFATDAIVEEPVVTPTAGYTPPTLRHFDPEECSALRLVGSLQLPTLFPGSATRDTLWPNSPIRGPKVSEFSIDLSTPDFGEARRDQIITFNIAGSDGTSAAGQAFRGAVLVSKMLEMFANDPRTTNDLDSSWVNDSPPSRINWDMARHAVAMHPYQVASQSVSNGTRSFTLVRRGINKDKICLLVRDYAPHMCAAPPDHLSGPIGSISSTETPRSMLEVPRRQAKALQSSLFPNALPYQLKYRECLLNLGPELHSIKDNLTAVKLDIDNRGLIIMSGDNTQMFSVDFLDLDEE